MSPLLRRSVGPGRGRRGRGRCRSRRSVVWPRRSRRRSVPRRAQPEAHGPGGTGPVAEDNPPVEMDECQHRRRDTLTPRHPSDGIATPDPVGNRLELVIRHVIGLFRHHVDAFGQHGGGNSRFRGQRFRLSPGSREIDLTQDLQQETMVIRMSGIELKGFLDLAARSSGFRARRAAAGRYGKYPETGTADPGLVWRDRLEDRPEARRAAILPRRIAGSSGVIDRVPHGWRRGP